MVLKKAKKIMTEFKSWFSIFYDIGIPKWIPETLLISIFVMICLIISSAFFTRNLKVRNPSKGQILFEMIMKSLVDFVSGLCPSEKKILVPILGTTFLVILFSNYIGIVPGFISSSSNIILPATLAVMAFFLVQFMGFSRLGFKYLKHFLGEPIWLAPLNIPVHIVSEIARPVSLSCRLYGNIYGEEMVIGVLLYIALNILPNFLHWVPLQLPMVFFALFSGFIQAFIFTLLVGLYVDMAISHEEV